MELEEQLEQLVLSCIDTAKAMLDEYGHVIPFGIRAFTDSDDMKMNCPADDHKDADWMEQIELVVTELKQFVSTENIAATVLVTGVESDEMHGIGLQIENSMSSVLFVYPYSKKDDKWEIEEPMQTQQLFSRVYDA